MLSDSFHRDHRTARLHRLGRPSAKQETVREKPFAGPIVTPIREAATFYAAEDYHQDYYEKNPLRYNYYRKRCGRDKKVAALWGDEVWAAKK